MLILFLCLMIFSFVYGGSKCPERSEIYPCICINKPIGKTKFETTIVCHALDGAASLRAIEPALTNLEINKFLLYDSFWSDDIRNQQMDSRTASNMISGFKMEEIEIVDTRMTNFGCPEESSCRINFVKRFAAINTTIPEKSSCGVKITSWVSCPSRTEMLVISRSLSAETSLRPEFFPEPLSKLKALHMPHNQISRIDRRTFTQTKFPVLQTLDLSYNSLRDVKNLFSSSLKLKILDLSYNSIRTLIDFQYLPHLQTLNLAHNNLVQLLENEWNILPANLRHVDLTFNVIDCSCSIKWVNSTFHISANLLGTCGTPPQVATMKLRRASRFLVERCDEDGKIGEKKKKKKKAE